jgi:hypothetical protein
MATLGERHRTRHTRESALTPRRWRCEVPACAAASAARVADPKSESFRMFVVGTGMAARVRPVFCHMIVDPHPVRRTPLQIG